jgi:DNA-binding CsgD family transcriptional regulator
MRTEYYNDFMRPHGDKYALSLSVLAPKIGRTSLTFYRGDRNGGDFSDGEVRRWDELRPFLRNTLLLRTLVRERGEAGKGIEGIKDPAFLVASGRDIKSLNPAGEDLLCARCKAAIPNPYAPFTSGGGQILPADSLPGRRYSGNGFLVSIPEAAAPPPLRERLRLRFGLTQTESAVAQALIDGLSYREIADEYGVSVHTVHTQVSSIHHKADVQTTRQFIALAHFDR